MKLKRYCNYCGKEIFIQASRYKQNNGGRFCSRGCITRNKKEVIGATRVCSGRINRDGYIQVLAKGYPSSNKKGYVLEHRLIMERSLDRYLKNYEIIHHKNEDREDNRIENLEVMTRAEHAAIHDNPHKGIV